MIALLGELAVEESPSGRDRLA